MGATTAIGSTKRGCRPTLVPSASVTPQAAIAITVTVF